MYSSSVAEAARRSSSSCASAASTPAPATPSAALTHCARTFSFSIVAPEKSLASMCSGKAIPS